ncbi:gliding motility-associated ABC transporter substrate-binding protein GldG [Tenacibaculum sp. IB213877]|uniref:gliding motility-associated ABC transporter substrate-binding protein GldG n=1 Tax=Tenacibaculum sp. IB213877 TaxID=3097351 RepID=UPI002A5A71FA|nr:gliding motility-associated ABC transporter substrate-binding protein GldG [Tenacibaculum sp. IB213877]MDY0781553.1 gliding motility-associated ABC transporter substrate-binding protein GldG [Tenacibaculum sp. IB213877]
MNKKLQHIALALVAVLLINFVSKKVFKRFDLTQDKRYTLSPISKNLIDDLDDMLLINVYLEGDFPSEFQRLQIETRQFLEELQAENSNIRFRFINPDNIRERLVKKGMMPSQLTVEEDGKLSEAIIFPWAEIEYQDKTQLVSLLPNTLAASQEAQLQNAIASLEYSFANSINTVLTTDKKKIAVLTGNGELSDIELYSLLSDLGTKYRLAKFTLDSVAKNPEKAVSDLTTYDLAIIAKPTQKFTAEEKLTIDQFITHGGKTLWMIDNVQADTDSLYNEGKMLAYPRDLGLTDLLFSYGVRINNQLVQDLYAAKIPLATGNVGNQPQFQNLDWFYHPLVGSNPNHTISKNVLPVRLRFATQIDTLQNNIQKTPLIVSSVLTKLVGTPKIIKLSSIAEEPTQEEFSAGNQLLGVLLEGEFTSAYANRIKPFELSDFKATSGANKMILISDGDFGKNQILRGQPYDLGIDKWTQQRFGNKDFLLNAIDYLLDDNGLISLRNKNVQLHMLDKQKAYAEKGTWQLINIIFPLAVLAIFGLIFNFYRKKKYQ